MSAPRSPANASIAHELGAAGATVYVTGRSTRAEAARGSETFLAQAPYAQMPGSMPPRRRCWQGVPPLARTESTRYIGRAVVALAADANVMAKSGTVQYVGKLAAEYGFTDVDGRVIPPFEM